MSVSKRSNSRSLSVISREERAWSRKSMRDLSRILRIGGGLSVTEKRLSDAAEILKRYGYVNPYDARFKALGLRGPRLDRRVVKYGSKAVPTPQALSAHQSKKAGRRRLRDGLRAEVSRSGRGSGARFLAKEVHLALQYGGGKTREKRNRLHKVAVANRASLRGAGGKL